MLLAAPCRDTSCKLQVDARLVGTGGVWLLVEDLERVMGLTLRN